jgi:hypothetical protein
MPPKTTAAVTAAAAEKKRCETCHTAGHTWKECENSCMLCGGVHHRLPCYAFPERYANLDLERARNDAAAALEKRVDTLARENAEKEKEVARLETMARVLKSSYGYDRGEFESSLPPPEQEDEGPQAAHQEVSGQAGEGRGGYARGQ